MLSPIGTPTWIVVMAASQGGLAAYRKVLAPLKPGLDAALFIVQHIGARPSNLPEILAQSTSLPVGFANHGEPIQAGRVYVAPPDRHMVLVDHRVWLQTGRKEHYTRPAADPLFRSAARTYGPRAIGVVLTGGDSDGAEGLRAIREKGGIAIVESPEGAANPEMPITSLRVDSPDYSLPVESIGPLLLRCVARP